MKVAARKPPADYTEGSIIGSILKMGLPSMVGFLTENIYNLVDMWWVSRLENSEAGVAALTFFGVILMLLFSFNQLVGPGSVAIISRRYGEKAYGLVEKAIKETILLKLAFGFVFGAVGWFFARELLALVGAEGQSLEMGVEYAGVMFLFLGLPYAAYSIFTALRGVANPHMAMYLMIGSNLLNMVLDPLLIFGYLGFPAMGIRGAAVASIISYGITLGVGLWILYGGRANVRLHLRGAEPISLAGLKRIIGIGVPAWLGSLSFSGSRLLIAPMIATYGTAVVAAYGVSMRVLGVGVMIIVGIGLGLSSLIGHNLGGDKQDRARHTGNQAILLSVGIMAFLGLIIFVFAEQLMSSFFDNPETIAVGIEVLRILAIAFPAIGIFLMIEEIHMGVGLNTPMMIFSIIHSWGFQVLPVFFITTVLHLSPSVVWWAITISIWLSASLVYWYYRRGRWLTVRV